MNIVDWFDEGGSGAPVDVAALFDSDLPGLLAACVQAGALVSVGATSDGGAIGITVMLDGRKRRQYVRSSEEAVDWLSGAAAALSAGGRPSSASSGARARSRRS